MKRILIDATALTGRITGLERYTQEVIKRLGRKAQSNSEIILAIHQGYGDDLNESAHLQVLKSPYKSLLLCQQIWIPNLIKWMKPDVCFYPAFPPGIMTWINRQRPKIVRTIHDAVMWQMKETLSWKNKLYMKPLENFGIKRYDVIHTVSHFSKNEICNVFPKIKDRVVVSGNGVNSDHYFQEHFPGCCDQTLEKYSIDEPYALFVGTIEPRKNLSLLVETIEKINSLGKYMNVLLVGRKGWGYRVLSKLIKKSKTEKMIRIINKINDTELSCLYKKAKAFVYPSIYEGFGLPLVEAMASGLPILASNTASMPEILGDAGILISSDDSLLWAKEIKNLMEDEKYRERLIQKGRQRCLNFSWDGVCNKIWETF